MDEPVAGQGASTGKVRVGFFSFTEVTDPAEHHSYNEWHQLDHMPEQFPLPGVAWGQRWVSTPACHRARAVEGGRLAPIHYVTLYLMTDPVPETLRQFAELGQQLHDVGRFHEHRRSLLSGPFTAVAALASPRALVSPAAVPFRPGTGVYVVVESLVEGASPDALRGPPDAAVLDVPAVAGAWSFAAGPDLLDTGDMARRWRAGAHRVTVCYLDGDPLEAAAALDGILVPGGRSPAGTADALEPVLAGPFEAITPWRWDWFD